MEKKKFKITKKKIIIIIGIIILILLAIIAIAIYMYLNTSEKEVKKPKKEEPEQVEVPVEEKKLTIVDEDSNQRPIAVMIDNNIGNGRHAGLQDSYINYEIIVEGGLTRIMALFKDKDVSLIGPVRSSRHYFLDYALESDAIYAHYGWSTYAQNDIKYLNVNNINGLYDSAPFWRDTTISAPHNVFTSIDKLYAYATQKNYNTTSTNWKLLNYTTDEVNLNTPISTTTQTNPETGEKTTIPITREGLLTANTVIIPYSYYQNRSYTYDSKRKVYLRYMNNTPHLDKTTGAQLYYKNIIIEKVRNSLLDNEGRQDLDTTGTGEGYYITNGYALPIYWTKSGRSAKTIYKYSDGSEVKINDGNTFIQIMPTTYTPTIS